VVFHRQQIFTSYPGNLQPAFLFNHFDGQRSIIKKSDEMKMESSSGSLTGYFTIFLLLMTGIGILPLRAQQPPVITGTVVENQSNQPVAYANIAVYDESGGNLLGGTAGDYKGVFTITGINIGACLIRISAIGYETFSEEIVLPYERSLDLGMIRLTTKEVILGDVSVVAGRIRATTADNKTTFYISKTMQSASNTGTDVLKFIPGIQMDLQQNISLEGSQNILILVDGRERSRSFISQLHAGKIDKIEIMSNPPSSYDGNVTGVINIITASDRETGIDGHIYTELPTADSDVFLFPTFSLNYGTDKFNLFTSYNGEMLYFNIRETSRREIIQDEVEKLIISNQQVRQKNWSHLFHYGLDLFLKEKNQLSFYGFLNPYSHEHDGIAEMLVTGIQNSQWFAGKEDDDTNKSHYNSLYYKHLFNETNNELKVDISHYHMNAENITTYNNEETGYLQINQLNPEQNRINVRIDHAIHLHERIKLTTGLQGRLNYMKNKGQEEFSYSEQSYGGYSSLSYNSSKLQLTAGLRFEYNTSRADNGSKYSSGSLLPEGSVNFKTGAVSGLRLAFRRGITCPGIYQLNPAWQSDDPYTVNAGNPDLRPGFKSNLAMEYSVRTGNKHLSSRLFYDKQTDAIQNLTKINENGIFETRSYNLGDIHQFGIQFTGSMNLTKNGGITFYLKLFDVHSIPGDPALQENIGERHRFTCETGISAYSNFGRGFSASGTCQYLSPMNQIQGNTFSDALYRFSLEKSFDRGLKAGFTGVLPFAGKFTYRGNEISSPEFKIYSKGVVDMSALPILVKVSYQFQSGIKLNKTERPSEVTDNHKRKGF
jgi:hypothetical protein